MTRGLLHAAEGAIMKVFCDDYRFTVPDYQRPYSWTTDQAGPLLEDLLSSMDSGNGTMCIENIENIDPYFLGSIVLIKEDSKPHSAIVDGQQRLVTLTILLAVLRALAPKDAAYLTEYIAQEGNPLVGRQENYRLTLRDMDADFFREYVQKTGGIEKVILLGDNSLKDDSQKYIKDNAALFLRRLEGLSENQRYSLSQFILLRCFLVVVTSPDDDAAFRVFEVLNDRGLDLTNADKLKAIIVGPIPGHDYQKTWEQYEADLGRDEFNNLFAHISMIYVKAKLRTTLLGELREQVLKRYMPPQGTPQDFINQVLVPYADALYTIRKADYRDSKHAEQLNALFGWLNRIDNSNWIPPAIFFFSRNKDDPQALLRFFNDLERLAAGMMVQRTFINARIERYGRLLKAIEDGHIEDLYREDSPLQVTADERGNILRLLEGDLYKMPRVAQYVLLRLNSAMTEGEARYTFPIITVEHVLPQQPPPNSKWIEWFPTQELRDQYVHRLGNLVLLSKRMNTRAQNYDFEQKKDRYFSEGEGSPFVLTAGVIKEHEWTPEVIKQRQQSLMKRLAEIWRL